MPQKLLVYRLTCAVWKVLRPGIHQIYIYIKVIRILHFKMIKCFVDLNGHFFCSCRRCKIKQTPELHLILSTQLYPLANLQLGRYLLSVYCPCQSSTINTIQNSCYLRGNISKLYQNQFIFTPSAGSKINAHKIQERFCHFKI